jgi:tartrate-resistant acid phosphatase type 5
MEVTRAPEQPGSAAHSTLVRPDALAPRNLPGQASLKCFRGATANHIILIVLALRLAALLLLTPAALAGDVPEVVLRPRGAALRLAVTGDTGNGADAVARGIAAVHARQALDAVILTGDNFYPCGVTSPRDPRWNLVTPLTRIGIPVFPVLGNHDSCGKADPDAQVDAPVANWRFPAREYAVRTAVADFAFADTTPFVRGGSTTLRSILPEILQESKAPWQILVAHHPVISSGYHGYFPRDEVRRMRELIPLLRTSGVDAVFAGHDHHLELIRGEFLHVISGAGSRPIPPIKLRVTTVYPPEIRRERIGFAVVEITEKAIRVRFHDERGRTRSEWIETRGK